MTARCIPRPCAPTPGLRPIPATLRSSITTTSAPFARVVVALWMVSRRMLPARAWTRPIRRSVRARRLEPRAWRAAFHKLHRRLVKGTARILRATISRDAAGRWHVSFTVEVQRGVERGTRHRLASVGVDVGVGDLLVAADAHGREVLRVPAPRPLGAAQARGNPAGRPPRLPLRDLDQLPNACARASSPW